MASMGGGGNSGSGYDRHRKLPYFYYYPTTPTTPYSKATMRLLLPTLSSLSLSTMCLAQRNHIISIKSINAIEGSRSNVRGGRNENELTIVSTPGDSNLVDDIDDSILGSSSTDESRSHTEIDSDNSISGDATDDGAPLTVEHHHRSHHQGHGQSQHHNNHSKSSSHENNGNSSFDFYVYSMSYQPEFCRENNEKFDGCRAFNESWEGQLTIHGLWPNNNDGTYPSTCTNEQLDISLIQNLSDSLANKWPNIKALSSSSPEHTAFWAHEWSKHGTCSGLSQLDYFSAALGLLVPTPAVVKERYGSGGTVTRQELEEGYTYHRYDNVSASRGGVGLLWGNDSDSSAVILVCKSGYLSEVRVCYGKKADGEGGVGDRMQCPDTITKEDSCGDTIKIASFDDSTAGLVLAE